MIIYSPVKAPLEPSCRCDPLPLAWAHRDPPAPPAARAQNHPQSWHWMNEAFLSGGNLIQTG